MIDQYTVDRALRRLEALDHPSIREDFRATARLAQRCILDLMRGEGQDENRVNYIAKQIADKAAGKPTMVYRLKKTGEIRWQSAASPSISRIAPEQIIGTYDHGAGWRSIAEDLRA